MIKQTVICDICKEEIKPQDNEWLKLSIQYNNMAYGWTPLVPYEMHVHLECWTERMGVRNSTQKEK